MYLCLCILDWYVQWIIRSVYRNVKSYRIISCKAALSPWRKRQLNRRLTPSGRARKKKGTRVAALLTSTKWRVPLDGASTNRANEIPWCLPGVKGRGTQKGETDHRDICFMDYYTMYDSRFIYIYTILRYNGPLETIYCIHEKISRNDISYIPSDK